MIPFILERVKAIVLQGPTADTIENCIINHPDYKGSPAILKAGGMEEAVNKAHSAATKGDVVTLSPACASFDAYANFMLRGDHYKKLVNELK